MRDHRPIIKECIPRIKDWRHIREPTVLWIVEKSHVIQMPVRI